MRHEASSVTTHNAVEGFCSAACLPTCAFARRSGGDRDRDPNNATTTLLPLRAAPLPPPPMSAPRVLFVGVAVAARPRARLGASSHARGAFLRPPHARRTARLPYGSTTERRQRARQGVRAAATGAGSAQADPPAAPADPLAKQVAAWRTRIFYSIFLGYASFYFTRNSFTYAAPVMRQALGFSLEQLGVIMSVFPLAYGFSKLVAGVLADRFSTRTFMAVGLAMTGVLNIIFGMQTSLAAFCVVWFANGVFQGFGAPPCAKLLTSWYPKSERGTWWGFWNTSHNTGGFLIPLLAGYCARAFGWQYGMIVPGCIAIVMAAFLYNRLRDNPESVGLPPVDPELLAEEKAARKTSPDSPELTLRQKLFKYVLSNPYVWLLALSYFFVYFVRQGVSSWAHIFLMDYKGVASAQEAAFRVSGMEMGGLLGSLVSGWASDKMMRGRRIPVIIMWLFGVMASVSALWFIPGSWRYATWLAVFAIGFFIYGPQMLVGLAGAEIVDRSAVSSTIGLLGWIAYLGAAVSGYPLTKLVTKLGWGAYFASLLGFSGIAILLLLPMWRLGMGVMAKPEPKIAPAVAAPAMAPTLSGAVVPLGATITQCGSCAGVGTVMRLECGPATPSMALSCRYIETVCPWCAGRGYLAPAPV
jgi:MFS transporter, OPA family, sugar phosphate sensor protein UhpC